MKRSIRASARTCGLWVVTMGKKIRRKYRALSLLDNNSASGEVSSAQTENSWVSNTPKPAVGYNLAKQNNVRVPSDIEGRKQWNQRYLYRDVNRNEYDSCEDVNSKSRPRRAEFCHYRPRGRGGNFARTDAKKSFHPNNMTVPNARFDKNILKRNDVYFHWNDLLNSTNIYQRSDCDDSCASQASSESDFLDTSGGSGDWVFCMPRYSSYTYPVLFCSRACECCIEFRNGERVCEPGLSFNISHVRRVDIPLEIHHDLLEQPNCTVKQEGKRAEVSLSNVFFDDEEVCPTCRHCRRSVTVDLTGADVEFSVEHKLYACIEDVPYKPSKVVTRLPYAPSVVDNQYFSDVLCCDQFDNIGVLDDWLNVEQSLEYCESRLWLWC